MKKTLFFCLMAMFAFAMTSCSDDDDDNNNNSSYQAVEVADGIQFTINGVQFKMVEVEGGSFMMGEESTEAWADEAPVHQVSLDDYYIGQTEVTQELWEAVMGSNPSQNESAKYPVESVSWVYCQTFIARLNKLTGKKFRLPTEAEWEFAARGGISSKNYKYSGSDQVADVAWYDDNSKGHIHEVGKKAPNELNLYDMSGNVAEWCADWYDEEYYVTSPQNNPEGPSSGDFRVVRGGSWTNQSTFSRVACRLNGSIDEISDITGLRLALDD